MCAKTPRHADPLVAGGLKIAGESSEAPGALFYNSGGRNSHIHVSYPCVGATIIYFLEKIEQNLAQSNQIRCAFGISSLGDLFQ